MLSFDFKKWCSDNGLKESTIEILRNNDLDSQDALKLVRADDVGTLDLTLGQRRLFMQALNLLNGNDQEQKTEEKHPSESTPVTTKSVANDGGLEDLLKKMGGISMDDPLLKLGATEQPFPVPLERVDNNPQVFLGTQHQAQKEGEKKPLLIPDFISTANYDGSIEDEQDIGGSAGARIVLRASRSKPKLENISLSMWVAANARIMHKLSKTGKLSGPSQIAGYLSYTVKVAELLESNTLASVVIYDNKYRKLQHQYGFCWGSDSQHLHTRFLVKRHPLTQSNQTLARPYAESRSNSGRPPQFVRPICRQFNSLSGCNWPQCRFEHVCLVANCSQPHPQHQHPPTMSTHRI